MADLEHMSLEDLERERHRLDEAIGGLRLQKAAVAQVIDRRLSEADAEALLGASPTQGQVNAMARVVGRLSSGSGAGAPQAGG